MSNIVSAASTPRPAPRLAPSKIFRLNPNARRGAGLGVAAAESNFGHVGINVSTPHRFLKGSPAGENIHFWGRDRFQILPGSGFLGSRTSVFVRLAGLFDRFVVWAFRVALGSGLLVSRALVFVRLADVFDRFVL